MTECRPLAVQLGTTAPLLLAPTAALPDDALALLAEVVYSLNGRTSTLGVLDVRLSTSAAKERGL